MPRLISASLIYVSKIPDLWRLLILQHPVKIRLHLIIPLTVI